MLKFIKRWFGWEEQSDYFDPEDFRLPARPPTAQVAATTPREPHFDGAAQTDASAPGHLTILDFVPDPRTETPEAGVDPYNTGQFELGAAWGRLGKNAR